MNELAGFPGRLRRWRQEEVALSLREMVEAVNEHLPGDLQVRSKSSLHNWETTRWGDRAQKAKRGPSAEYIVALKRAFPDLNLRWLLFGHGEPRVSDEQAKAFQQRISSLPSPSADTLLPTIWLRRHLPRRAKEALVSFFREVAESDLIYFGSDVDPTWAESEEPVPLDVTGRRIDRLKRQVGRLLQAPFQGEGEAWVSIDELSDAEIISYVEHQLASWRMLLRSMREGD